MFVITGASRGIGKYLFENFSINGEEQVIGTYHHTKPQNDNNYYKIDLTDYDQVFNFIETIKVKNNNIVLINCAGINYNSFMHKSCPEQWNKVIINNIIGTYNIIRVVLPIMRNENFGKIINFSSVTAQKPTLGVSAYATSKSALWGLTKSIMCENAKYGITINNINLGYFDIGMGTDSISPSNRQSIIETIPSNRFGNPKEILTTIEYIINNEYLNGSSIDLNGGLI